MKKEINKIVSETTEVTVAGRVVAEATVSTKENYMEFEIRFPDNSFRKFWFSYKVLEGPIVKARKTKRSL